MKIIASNFKTNHTRLETRKFIETINNVISENNITNEVIIFPSLTALDSFDNIKASDKFKMTDWVCPTTML